MLFAEVQSAYEVLSDPQERAWYDSHRSAILRGEGEDAGEHYEHNVRVTTSADIMRVFTKFNARMDFSDSTNGFFTVLRNTFDTLAEEEAMACDWEGLEPIRYPTFGHAKDGYEEVVRPFYAIWNGFATRKTFSWMDVYRYADAPDRRVRRMMEKENKRFRDEGIREFNATVRSLVQFVRKRDPRYVPNTQTEAERQKIIRDAATAQAARSRAANRAKAAQQESIPNWTRNDDPIEGEVSKEEEQEPEEQLECVVCRKTFKSENQFEAHERSKKHSKAVQRLQREMRTEDKALNLNDQDGIESPPAGEADVLPDNEGTRDLDAGKERRAPNLDVTEQAGNAGTLPVNVNDSSDITAELPPMEKKPSAPASDTSSTSSIDDDYVSREKIEERILGDVEDAHTGLSTPQSIVDDLSQKLANGSLDHSEADSASRPKLGKAKEKRAKKAAQQSASSATTEFQCTACNTGFPSKTRLFSHIKEFGHAQPVPRAAKGGKGKKR